MGALLIDYTGQQVKAGQVIRLAKAGSAGKHTKWLITCHCGNIRMIDSNGLNRNDYCIKCLPSREPIDRTGTVSGQISIVERLGPRKYRALCNCGKTSIVRWVTGRKAPEYCSSRCPMVVEKARKAKEKKAKENHKSGNRNYVTAKCQAKTRGLEFSLTLEEFNSITQASCRYCLAPPSNKATKYGIKRSGIDRVDNNQGYTKENSAPCCGTCNLMKRHMPLHAFLKHVQQIAKHNNLA